MNRPNVIKEGIATFNLGNFEAALRENPVPLFEFLAQLASRKISVSDLDIDRKLFYTWKKNNLLPFEQEEGRNRFSFIECCWLKMVIELREVGVGFDKIIKMKDLFFSTSFIDDFFAKDIEPIERVTLDIEQLKKQGVEFRNNRIVLTKKLKKIYHDELQFSLFTIVIYSIIMQRSNLCVYMDSTGHIDAFDVNNLIVDTIEEVPRWIEFFSNKSIVVVNLKKIVAALSDTHEYFSKTLEVDFKMSQTAVDHLKQQFIDKNVSEVTIRINQKGNPTVFVKKNMKLDELQSNIKMLTKKGSFRDIIVKTRDGKVQYFETVELLKL